MNKSFIRFCNSFIVYAVSVILTLQPMMTYASGGIAVDAGAAAANRASLDAAQNGVPIVNIVNPNANGLSHNKFTDFNVGADGVIVNNSLTLGVSQLGGAINGNANLSAEARLILNEVTSSNRSALNGATEIFGGRAEYILANPNGITCNGCGFINTPRVTLSTGTPVLQDGGLFGFDVTGGEVAFEGLAFNGVTGDLALDAFDIVARTARIATELHVRGELNIVTGANEVKYSDLSTTTQAGSGTAPSVAIDSSVIGGMYAGKIKLVATEAGVGVRTAGALVTDAEDMMITANGQITYSNLVSGAGVNVSGAGVEQTGSAYAANNLSLSATRGDIELGGDLAAAGGDVTLDASGDITLDDVQVQSGLVVTTYGDGNASFSEGNGELTLNAGGDIDNAGGDVIAGGHLTLTTDHSFSNSGFMKAADVLNITAGSVDNRTTYSVVGGEHTKGIHGLGAVNLTATTGDIDNTAGAITSGGNLAVTANGGQLINSGLVQSEGSLTVNTVGLNNQGSYSADSATGLLAGGDIAINVGAGDIANTNGLISGDNIMLTGVGSLANNAAIIAGGNLAIDMGSVDNSGSYAEDAGGAIIKGLLAGGIITIDNNATSIDNAGGAIVADTLDLRSSGALDNEAGLVQGTHGIDLTVASISNINTYAAADVDRGILSDGDINIVASGNSLVVSEIDNTDGIIDGANVTLMAANGDIRNTALIQSSGNMSLEAAAINNSGSYELVGNTITKGLISGGNASLISTGGDINNEDGAMDARGNLTLTSANDLINTDGYISSAATTGTSTLTVANNLNNTNGKILAAGDMDVITNGGGNDGGIISSLKDLLVRSLGSALTNNSGHLYAEETLTLKNVDNQSGTIQAGDSITIDNSDIGDFDNNAGKVLAFNDGSVVSINVATLWTQAVSIQNINLNENSYTISGDVTTGGHFDITADSLTNNATVNAGDYISIVLTAGSFTNNSNGKLISADSITIDLTGAGSVLNYGELSAPDIDINIANGDLNNMDGAVISASYEPVDPTDMLNRSTINITDGKIRNFGRISAKGDLNINADTLYNGSDQNTPGFYHTVTGEWIDLENETGTIAVDRDLVVETDGNTVNNLNGSVIYATNDVKLYTNALNNNGGSHIYSLDGDITIQRNDGGTNSTSVTNTSSTIEAYGGDITIKANNITNTRDSFVTVQQPRTNHDQNADGIDDDGELPNANSPLIGNIYDADWLNEKLALGSDNEYYTTALDSSWQVWIFRADGTNGNSAVISAANDITITSNSMDNKGSQIYAGNDITLNGGTIKNTGYVLEEWMVAVRSHGYGSDWANSLYSGNNSNGGWVSAFDEKNGWISDGLPASGGYIQQGLNLMRRESVSSSIEAGGRIHGTVTTFENTNQVSSSPYATSTQGAAVPDITLRDESTFASVFDVDNERSPLNNGQSVIGAVEAGALSYSSSPALDTRRFADIPTQDNGLFVRNDNPAANYLVETNIEFIDLNRFRGSEYFLGRIGYVVPADTKLLGDAFYETNLVRSAVFERTSQRYLTAGIGTDFAQMTTLFDNAVTEQTALALTVGIELTAAQIAALTSDIIWLVEDDIDGQKVLKPVVYLAQATMDALHGSGAQIIAGNDIDISASDKIVNSGLIKAGADLTLEAQNDIDNTGKMQAGQDINLASTAGSVTNKAVVKRSETGGNLSAFIQSIGEIISGRDTTITAAEDVVNTASKITAGRDLTLTATGGDVVIDTEALRNRTESRTKHSYSLDDTTTHVVSYIEVANDITITGGNNVILESATLDAGNDVDLTATNTVALLSTKDSAFHQKKKSKSSLLWQSSSDKGSYAETVNHVEITKGGDLSINGNAVIVDIKNMGTITESIDELAKTPELAYLAELKNNPDINWNKVDEAYKSWDYKQQGLTPAAAVIIAIAVTAATWGAGSAAMGSMGFVGMGPAAAGQTLISGTTMAVGSASIGAAAASLASTAAISLANNQGDLGEVFKELGSSETVKNLAFAAVTGGATHGTSAMFDSGIVGQTQTAVTNGLVRAGVSSIVYGSDFGEGAIDGIILGAANVAGSNIAGQIGVTSGSLGASPLNAALATGAYVAVGCAAGAVTIGNCGDGAVASVAGATAGHLGADQNIAGLIGAGTIAIINNGADAKDVYAANSIAGNAAAGVYLGAQTPVTFVNPNTGQVFDAYGRLVGTTGGVLGDVAQGASPVHASRWVDGNNRIFPAPHPIPGLGLTKSETGRDPIIDETTKMPIERPFPQNFITGENTNPLLKGMYHLVPMFPSNTQVHDVGMTGVADDITKAVTIPSYFFYNTYGAVGTAVDVKKYNQNIPAITDSVLNGNE